MRPLAFLAIALAARAGEPTQPQLIAALTRAAAAWRVAAPGVTIRATRINACAIGEPAGWSDLVNREIQINTACHWDARYLQTIVTHEYGHMLTGQGHSRNRHSVMFAAPVRVPRFLFLDQPGIRRADRALARDAAQRERPTILRGTE